MELVHKLLATRGGTIALGGVAAVMAAFVLLLYLSQYRSSVAADSEPVTVLVAKKLIEKGMPGDVVGFRRLFEAEQAPQSQLRDGAITDPSTLRGRVAVEDIYPGQQLTVGDFAATTTALGAKLSGKHRAISLPLDAARGLIGKVEAGDRVDVFATLTVREEKLLKVIAQNAVVLEAPAETGSGVGQANQISNVVLRVNDEQAAEMAFAVDEGKVWIVLRPRHGAPVTRPGVVSSASIVAGIKPKKVYNEVRKALRSGALAGQR